MLAIISIYLFVFDDFLTASIVAVAVIVIVIVSIVAIFVVVWNYRSITSSYLIFLETQVNFCVVLVAQEGPVRQAMSLSLHTAVRYCMLVSVCVFVVWMFVYWCIAGCMDMWLMCGVAVLWCMTDSFFS